jgi:hypothetical protein
MKLRSNLQQPFVSCPKQGTRHKSDSRKQMSVDVSNSQSEEPMPGNKMEHFVMVSDLCSGQIAQFTQQQIPPPESAHSKFTDYERMGKHLPHPEQTSHPCLSLPQMIDPH